MKVSEKGAVSIYGMGRFPVTLYKEQWLKAVGHVLRHSGVHCRERSKIESEGLMPSFLKAGPLNEEKNTMAP